MLEARAWGALHPGFSCLPSSSTRALGVLSALPQALAQSEASSEDQVGIQGELKARPAPASPRRTLHPAALPGFTI